ncbi:MAG: 5-formyltetrahydrofolate cyclo-ligase [Tepidanaerobacteraceae bacterium]|jgi:5-formyltetrahydrofolate cyclo-ligase
MKDKSRLRKRFIEQRLRFLQDEVKQKSDIIMSTLFSTDYYKKAKLVMFYVDMRNEVMTKGAIEETLSNGKRVVVPRVKKGYGLLAIEIESLAELNPGTFGVLEPPERDEVPLDDIDVVVIPGVVFDKKGYRIGYGGGYYDNFLPKLKVDTKKIALAFEMQLIDSVPAESHDMKMDMIITEKRTYGPFY